jgi:hypothetical protein
MRRADAPDAASDADAPAAPAVAAWRVVSAADARATDADAVASERHT